MGQMTEFSQWPKCLSEKKQAYMPMPNGMPIDKMKIFLQKLDTSETESSSILWGVWRTAMGLKFKLRAASAKTKEKTQMQCFVVAQEVNSQASLQHTSRSTESLPRIRSFTSAMSMQCRSDLWRRLVFKNAATVPIRLHPCHRAIKAGSLNIKSPIWEIMTSRNITRNRNNSPQR